MKNGKSKLLPELALGKTLYILICPLDPHPNVPCGLSYTYRAYSLRQWTANLPRHVELSDSFDRFVFYSNEYLNDNVDYIEDIGKILDLGKCVFMFKGFKED